MTRQPVRRTLYTHHLRGGRALNPAGPPRPRLQLRGTWWDAPPYAGGLRGDGHVALIGGFKSSNQTGRSLKNLEGVETS